MTDRHREENKLPPLSNLNAILINESADTYDEESFENTDDSEDDKLKYQNTLSRFNK